MFKLQVLPNGRFAQVRTDTGAVVSSHPTRSQAAGRIIRDMRGQAKTKQEVGAALRNLGVE